MLLLCAMSAGQAAWSAAAAEPTPVAAEWLGSFLTRVEALALLQTLNVDLLSHDSATATLERGDDDAEAHDRVQAGRHHV